MGNGKAVSCKMRHPAARRGAGGALLVGVLLLAPGIGALPGQAPPSGHLAEGQVDALRLAASLFEAIQGPGGSLDRTVEAALRAHGTTLSREASPRGLPSEAIRHLTGGMALSPEQAAHVESLDRLPAPTRDALARVIRAFSDFHDAAASRSLSSPAFLAARAALVEAAWSLDAVRDPLTFAGCKLLTLPPFLVIDESACVASYSVTDNYLLILDLGGDDVYGNNAGGNQNACAGWHVRAAAIIDLGGNDVYQQDCLLPGIRGTTGGGYQGAGFLFDARGDDVYRSHGGDGANGGGSLDGAGFLLDAEGDDEYVVEGGWGVNGGGSKGGRGTLLDGEGFDRYEAGPGDGANGGAGAFSQGLLVEGGGDDDYGAWGGNGVNGGAFVNGMGMLLDAGGNDFYHADLRGVNGGAYGGIGVLVDLWGTDIYVAGTSSAQGENGGGEFGGAGLLLDGSGLGDSYLDSFCPAWCVDTTFVTKSWSGWRGLQLDAPGDSPFTGGCGGYATVSLLAVDLYISPNGPHVWIEDNANPGLQCSGPGADTLLV